MIGTDAAGREPGLDSGSNATLLELRLLSRGDEAPRVISSFQLSDATPVQSLYKISPDRKWLAYRVGDDLRLRDGAGQEQLIAGVRNFRFSPDGRQLAIARAKALVLIDLVNGTHVRRARLHDGLELAWSAAGLVVEDRVGDGYEILLVQASRVRRLRVLRKPAARLFATGESTRVVWFSGDGIWTLDLAQQRQRPRRLAAWNAPLANADVSPDGSRVLYVDDDGAHLLDGDAAPRLLAVAPRGDLNYVSALWFSPDGAGFVRSDGGELIVRRGEREWSSRRALGDKVHGARYGRQPGELFVAGRERAFAWDPARAVTRPLLDVLDYGWWIDVDQYDGGTIGVVEH